MKKEVWSVTYWDVGEEPVISLFDNEESARKCYEYFKSNHDGCCIDKCNIFSNFFNKLKGNLKRAETVGERVEKGDAG